MLFSWGRGLHFPARVCMGSKRFWNGPFWFLPRNMQCEIFCFAVLLWNLYCDIVLQILSQRVGSLWHLSCVFDKLPRARSFCHGILIFATFSSWELLLYMVQSVVRKELSLLCERSAFGAHVLWFEFSSVLWVVMSWNCCQNKDLESYFSNFLLFSFAQGVFSILSVLLCPCEWWPQRCDCTWYVLVIKLCRRRDLVQ